MAANVIFKCAKTLEKRLFILYKHINIASNGENIKFVYRKCHFVASRHRDLPVCCVLHSRKQTTSASPDAIATKGNFREKITSGPDLKHFIASSVKTKTDASQCQDVEYEHHPYIQKSSVSGQGRKVYLETYGCQMNVNDTEIVLSILKNVDYERTFVIDEADVILVVTCAIREGAEQKIWNRLKFLRTLKRKIKFIHNKTLKIGILGCMAERLKHKVIEREKIVDLVAGPDSYKDLPRMLAVTEDDQTAINVMLSYDETYADIMPVRLNPESPTAFVSIMRGCDNMCSFCIVPFTRGRERSRPLESIIEEIRMLSDQGIKQVTLLGQNVNSYCDTSQQQHHAPSLGSAEETHLSKGFKTIYKPKKGGFRFADLLDQASAVNPEMRIRFTSPHPKDFPNEVLHLIKERNNICNQLHLPAQCGSDRILHRMKRGHTREAYLNLVHNIRNIIPGVALSSDFICGFCGETEAEFEQTLSLVRQVKYHFIYMFPYSMREKTYAYYTYKDDVPEDVKLDRHTRLMNLFRQEVLLLNQQQIGQIQLVLIESKSKRSDLDLAGRNDINTKVIIPNEEILCSNVSDVKRTICIGDYVVVKITDANSQVLKGQPLFHATLQEFSTFSDIQRLPETFSQALKQDLPNAL